MKASNLRHQSNHNIPSFQNVRAPLRGVTGTASFQGRMVKSEVLQSGLQSNNFLIRRCCLCRPGDCVSCPCANDEGLASHTKSCVLICSSIISADLRSNLDALEYEYQVTPLRVYVNDKSSNPLTLTRPSMVLSSKFILNCAILYCLKLAMFSNP